jgi:hypothetical protein
MADVLLFFSLEWDGKEIWVNVGKEMKVRNGEGIDERYNDNSDLITDTRKSPSMFVTRYRK